MVATPMLSLRMQLRVSPQLVLACQLLQASGTELEDLVRAEVEANPALEQVQSVEPHRFSDWGLPGSANASLPDWESLEERQPARLSGIEQLAAQAALLVDRANLPVVLELLYSLDGSGYLRESLEEISRRIGFGVERLELALRALHALEPPGIGARDLRECLLLQSAHLQAQGLGCELAGRILSEAWEEFRGLRWARVANRVGTSKANVEEAVKFITRNLYPHPLGLLRDGSEASEPLLIPDLIIRPVLDRDPPAYRLEIPGEELYELRLSAQFERIFHSREKNAFAVMAEEHEWMELHIGRARLFLAAVAQRWGTLRRVGEFLIDYQKDFLHYGSRCLKPITRAAVAESLGLHESTVSRAVSQKIAQLPNTRLLPLSEFFNASLPVRESIQSLLSRSDRPLSDREITEQLKAQGLDIARRTVTKYREQLKSSPAHKRLLV